MRAKSDASWKALKQGCKRSLWKWSRSKIKIIPKKIKIIAKKINILPLKIKIIAKRSRSIKWSWSFRWISKIKITFLSVGCDTYMTTLLWKGNWVWFEIPVKIPAEYLFIVPRLPFNQKIKIFWVGTYFTL